MKTTAEKLLDKVIKEWKRRRKEEIRFRKQPIMMSPKMYEQFKSLSEKEQEEVQRLY